MSPIGNASTNVSSIYSTLSLRIVRVALLPIWGAWNYILALVLLAFTTRRMVRSTHLTLSRTRFTAQLNFAVLNRYSYEKIHIVSFVRRDELISALVTTTSLRLKARAWCGDLCWDEPSQRCRMHIDPFVIDCSHSVAQRVSLLVVTTNIIPPFVYLIM